MLQNRTRADTLPHPYAHYRGVRVVYSLTTWTFAIFLLHAVFVANLRLFCNLAFRLSFSTPPLRFRLGGIPSTFLHVLHINLAYLLNYLLRSTENTLDVNLTKNS